MISGKSLYIIIHLAAWLLFFSLPLLFMYEDFGWLTVISLPHYWFFCISFLSVYYLTSLVLIPKLYSQKKYSLFICSLLLLFSMAIFVKPFDRLVRATRQTKTVTTPASDTQQPIALPKKPNTAAIKFFDIVSFFLFITVVTLAMTIEVTRLWRVSQQRIVKIEADKTKAELSFLKAQINPHFLFNTLNNIYTLAILKSDKTADSVMKLSKIMRYMMDDVEEDFVSLSSEAECIANYITLQKLRLGPGTTVNFSINGNISNKSIAPLILMAFVENVFKYGVSNHEDSPINIQLSSGDGCISFFCENRIFKNTRTDRSGIGLKNTSERLKQIYRENYSLKVNNEDNKFTVLLSLHV